MSLDISDELDVPGITVWIDQPQFAVGAYRPPPGAVAAERESLEDFHCVGLSGRTGMLEVEGEGVSSMGPDKIRFHNRGDRLLERAHDDRPTTEYWLVLDGDRARTLAAEAGSPSADRPFDRSCVAPALPELASLRRFFAQVEKGACPFWAEERMIDLVPRLLLSGRVERPVASSASPGQLRLARDADALLAESFSESLTLSEVARTLGVSAPHLARAYRAATGGRMHSRLTSLRLAAAMERLADEAADLTMLALDLGFADHSHFTAAFRRHVGTTPSAYRASCAA